MKTHLTLLLFIFCLSKVNAQETEEKTRKFSLALFYGPAISRSLGSDELRAINAGIGSLATYKLSEKTITGLRTSVYGKLSFNDGNAGSSNIFANDALIGRQLNRTFSFLGGISYASGRRLGKLIYEDDGFFSSTRYYEVYKYQSLGLPLLLRARFKWFGVQLYHNIQPKTRYTAFEITFYPF